MNDPQEKSTKNPYHINYKNYLDTNACTECTGLIDFMPVPESQDLTDKQD